MSSKPEASSVCDLISSSRGRIAQLEDFWIDQLIPSESYSILTVGLTTKASRYTVSVLLELDFRLLLYID